MNNLIVYGIGSTGKYIVNCLLKKKIKIKFIVDEFTNIKFYKSIPIKKIVNLKKINRDFNLLLLLHNHYSDINGLYKKLIKFKFKKIYSLINFPKITFICNFKTQRESRGGYNWYWLDPNFKYKKYKKKIKKLQKILYDKESKILLDKVIDYRDSGEISKCPLPSLRDQYVPKDLPKYRTAINYIDCGADKGQTIENMSKLGVKLNSVIAFEPDKNNFKKLLEVKKKNYYFYRTGVFSKKCILKFNSTSSMSSSLIFEKSNKIGNSMINCDKLDNFGKNFIPHLIKYDVEGAEIEALKGSKNTIIKHMPNLAVSLYHKPKHLFEIPLLIKSWNLNYRFYLRLHEYNTYGLVLYCYK
jgi:FkbM family methyltransferase